MKLPSKLGKKVEGKMNKQEILEKSRQENSYLDEKQQVEIKEGFGFGGAIVAILCFVFSVIKVMQKESFFEFGVILFGYLAAIAWYSFTKTKKKSFLIQGIACGFTCILGFLSYFIIG